MSLTLLFVSFIFFLAGRLISGRLLVASLLLFDAAFESERPEYHLGIGVGDVEDARSGEASLLVLCYEEDQLEAHYIAHTKVGPLLV